MNKLVIGNLKMNIVTPGERELYFRNFRKEKKKLAGVEVVLCPPAIHLESFSRDLRRKDIFFGAQNIFWEKKGSFTGEISAEMAKGIGASYVIAGHSERKKYFGETDEAVNLKIKSIIKAGIQAVFCLGEKGGERERDMTKKIISQQIEKGLEGISRVNLARVIFVYEPVWAVGTDKVPTADEILEVKILMRKILTEKYGHKYAQSARILYGGSVNSRTVHETCIGPGMDGVLVGRGALIPAEFLKIAEAISKS